MTPEERKNPEIMNGSRRARVAKGAGRSISDVNRLLEQFREMQKMMKKMGGLGGKKGRKGRGPNPFGALGGQPDLGGLEDLLGGAPDPLGGIGKSGRPDLPPGFR